MKINRVTKGELLLKALDMLERLTYTTADFVGDFLASSKSNYLPLRNSVVKHHRTLAEDLIEELHERQRFYNLITRLQRDKLIQKTEKSRSAIWKITKRGKEKLQELKRNIFLLKPPASYKAESSKEFIIVSFDIPEENRHKRDWLRSVLKNLGLQMLQKSVWIGKIKIPLALLEDFKKVRVLDYLEIFSVGKTGTIKHIT